MHSVNRFNEKLQPAVMLTALLSSPDPDSHQKTPSESAFMDHVDLVIVSWGSHSNNRTPFSENLHNLSLLEYPSQVRWILSSKSCCTLFGLTVRDTDEESEKRDMKCETATNGLNLSSMKNVKPSAETPSQSQSCFCE